jgi:hypothetical protein
MKSKRRCQMGNIISPAYLQDSQTAHPGHRNTPHLFLGRTKIIVISQLAQEQLKLKNRQENKILIYEEAEKLYIKKADKEDIKAWPVSQYKNAGFRICKSSLYRFIRKFFKVSDPNKKLYLYLKKAELNVFELTSLEETEVPHD